MTCNSKFKMQNANAAWLRAVLCLHFAFCILHFTARPTSAQVGERVVEVVLEQEGQTITDPVILSLVETTVGEPLSIRDVRETTTHLMSLNRFEDVQSVSEPVPGGVRIRYVLRPLHPVDRVEFRGSLGLGIDELRRLVTDRFGRAPSATRAGDIADMLRVTYRSRGYPAARVTPRIEETHNPDRATLALEIEAGTRSVITNVQLIQVDADEQGPIPLIPAIREGQFYDEQAIEAELEDWIEEMHERGFFSARATHGASFPEGGVFVQVNVARGPHVTIAFTGEPLPESERDRLVPVRAEGAVDEDLLEDATIRIENYLFARGYRDADVEFTRAERAGELTITFNVKRGPRTVVERVIVNGNTQISLAELRQIFGLKEGDVFVRSALNAGAGALVSTYRARGFRAMKVDTRDALLPAGDPANTDRGVEVTLTITEGPRTVVRSVAFKGNTAVPEAELLALTSVDPGRPFSVVEVARDRDTLDIEYRNRGYDSVVVNAEAAFSETGTEADVVYAIAEGPQVLVDHVIIVGNQRTSSRTIERELLLMPGQPLGYSSLIESRARLMALGLFRGVRIEPLGAAGAARRDILISVEEADPTTLGLGGGVEGTPLLRRGEGGQAEERFEFAPRGFFEIGRRNLWGKNRSATLFTRVSLRERQLGLSEEGVALIEPGDDDSSVGFNEYRVVGTFREPRIFGTRADILVTGRFEQAMRSSFNFSRRDVRAEAGLQLSPIYSVAGRFSFERTKLFDEKFRPDEQPLIDRLFGEVRLARVSASGIRNTRNDPLDPTTGSLILLDADLAARALGSEVGFVRAFAQGFLFRQLPAARNVVAAFGARLGASHGFPREKDGDLVEDDLPASERFFAGGDTSVRGFSLDRLGNEDTITQSGFPTGGNAVIVLNAELRATVFGPVQAVGFFDAGNVFMRATDLDLMDLRPAAGIGARYRSPVGPIRIDLGFNLDRRELVAGTRERGHVWHISLGQAF